MAGNETTQANLRSVISSNAYCFLVNGEPLSVNSDFSEEDYYDAVTLTVEQLNSFEWIDGDDAVSITVNGVALENGKCQFALDTISQDDKIYVQVTEGEETRGFYINTLNSNLPLITTEGSAQTPGDFFLSFINTRSIVKTDNDGNILYYRNEDSEETQYGLWDFKTHQIDGKTYYSYHSTYSNPEQIVFTGHNPGERVIMDENYNEVVRINAIATEKNNGDTSLDGHEFLMLGEDHYIVMSYLQVEADNIPDINCFTGEQLEHADNAVLVAAYIQEIDHGEVKFEWLSTEYPELYCMTSSAENEEATNFNNTDPNTYVDYVHLNAIVVDDDGNLVISCRHLNTMIKIDRVGGTGDFIWRLSGIGDDFGLTDEQNTSGQHYLHYYGNGYFSAFNNNNKEGLTNLVLYHLNEDETALAANDSFNVWVVPGTTEVEPGFPCPPHNTYACGSFQIIGDYGVAGWGWNISGDELVTEFSLDDATQISFQLHSIYDPEASCATYRAVKCLSSAPELTFTQDSVSWSEINASSGYRLIIERNDTEGAMFFSSGTTALDIFNLPNGEYSATIREKDFGVSSAKMPMTVEDNLTQAVFVSEANGVADIFFAKPTGIWSSSYSAKNTGFVNGWEGTGNRVSLAGKNQLGDLFFGSADSGILMLTDDENGDALFIDDIYSSSPDDIGLTQARIGQIHQIAAGAGNDIVDLTSQRFEYIGSGVYIYGGDGDDVIWSNKGNNFLLGDAGNDRLVGGSDNDILSGGSGNDEMHGGGGRDAFVFGGDWGNDTVEQLATGQVVLWFQDGDESKWDQASLTYTDGANSVKVIGVTEVSLIFGDDNGNQSENYNYLLSHGAFSDYSTSRIYTDSGMLA